MIENEYCVINKKRMFLNKFTNSEKGLRELAVESLNQIS